MHGAEIAFVFGSFTGIEGIDTFKFFPRKTEETTRLSSMMMDAWINFARHGNPNHHNIPKWPQYDANKRPMIVFDKETKIKTDLYVIRDALWREITI